MGGRHCGEYDEWCDLERAYNEMRAEDHDDQCHWTCFLHRQCGCEVEADFATLTTLPLGATSREIDAVKADLRDLILRSTLNA